MARRSKRKVFGGAVCVACLLMALGCAGSRLNSADAGRTRVYEPGVPNFDMEAVATWRDRATGIDVYVGIPRVSLVFVQAGEVYTATYEVIVQVLDREDEDELAAEVVAEDTLHVQSYEATQAFEPAIHHWRLEVPPGSYRVEVQLTDTETGKDVLRRQQVDIPAPDEGTALSRIRLEATGADERAAPALALHLPAQLDSLRAVVELSPGRAADSLAITMALTRVPSDTTVATPPYWFMPTLGSEVYRGIFYGRAETLQVSQRRLQPTEETILEFTLPPLDPGMYHVVISGRRAGATEKEQLLQRRLLSVKSPTFPRIASIDQMTEALTYITKPKELKRIQAAETPQEQRERFDAFWGSLLADRQRAANLIKTYYGRVEEANLFYTSYKAGWKTDRGMIYIVLGAPLYVEQRADGEAWHYSYADNDPLHTFFFRRVRGQDMDDAVEHYVLQRQPYYEIPWMRAIERWRDGEVL